MLLKKQIMDSSLESFCSCDMGHLDWELPELSNCNALDIVIETLYTVPAGTCLAPHVYLDYKTTF